MATTIAVLCKLVHHCNTFWLNKTAILQIKTLSPPPLTISIQEKETFWLFGVFKVAFSTHDKFINNFSSLHWAYSATLETKGSNQTLVIKLLIQSWENLAKIIYQQYLIYKKPMFYLLWVNPLIQSWENSAKNYPSAIINILENPCFFPGGIWYFSLDKNSIGLSTLLVLRCRNLPLEGPPMA